MGPRQGLRGSERNRGIQEHGHQAISKRKPGVLWPMGCVEADAPHILGGQDFVREVTKLAFEMCLCHRTHRGGRACDQGSFPAPVLCHSIPQQTRSTCCVCVA